MLVVAVVIYFYPWLKVLDPVAAIGIALLIFKLLWSTLVDSCRIQLNAVPVGEDYEAIQVDNFCFFFSQFAHCLAKYFQI